MARLDIITQMHTLDRCFPSLLGDLFEANLEGQSMRHEKPQPCKHVELQVHICRQLIIYQDSQNYDSFDKLFQVR